MKHLAIILCLICASPAFAQEEKDDDNWSLMGRGAQMMMEGLLGEMEPALEDLQDIAREFGPSLRDFVDHMGPALRDLLSEVKDWSVYEAPEILDNGDIIIRRKPTDKDGEPKDPDAQIDI